MVQLIDNWRSLLEKSYFYRAYRIRDGLISRNMPQIIRYTRELLMFSYDVYDADADILHKGFRNFVEEGTFQNQYFLDAVYAYANALARYDTKERINLYFKHLEDDCEPLIIEVYTTHDSYHKIATITPETNLEEVPIWHFIEIESPMLT